MKVLNKQEKQEYYSDKSKNYVDWCVKHYEVIELDDCFLEWKIAGVQSEFWYDDETPSPLTSDQDQRHGFFIRENMSQADNWKYNRWFQLREDGYDSSYDRHLYYSKTLAEPYIQIAPHSTRGELVLWRHYYDFDSPEYLESKGYTIRPATEQELEFIGQAQEQFLAKYRKRLETYWKKYSHKVCAHGYWANR